MITFKQNGVSVDHYEAKYVGKHLVIAIDSSKTNSAMLVGDTDGKVLDDYEISGAGRDTNVYDLCRYTRRELKNLFRGSYIEFVGIEDIITKKEESNGSKGNGWHSSKGLEIHQSRYKITAVFDNFIFYFDEFHNCMPTLIPQWSWKSTTLPPEYRMRTHKKGSKDYMQDMGWSYGNRKDDVTDAFFILMYIYQTYSFNVTRFIDEIVPTQKSYDYIILPEDVTMPKTPVYESRNTDDLKHNIESIVERTDSGESALLVWDIEDLSIQEVYSGRLQNIRGFKFTKNDKQVKVFIEVK